MTQKSRKRIYQIDKNKCTGCGDCVKVCPANAINRYKSDLCAKCIKYCISINQKELQCTENTMCIIEKLCTGCGDCVAICKSRAIKKSN